MKKYLLFSFLIISSSILDAQFVGNGSFDGSKRTYLDDGAWAPREHNVDFIHMSLEISFDTKAGKVNGKVTHRFSPLQKNVDSVWVDGPGIKILDASVNGKTVSFRTEEQGTWIKMEKTHQPLETDSMTLVYECTPRHGLYFVGWNDPAGICRKQIWSQGQGIDNRNWIPFYDEMNDKITTDMMVTFDKDYKVLSNGNKISEKENKDGTKTWHYQLTKPFAPYLVMLGIGIYDIKETHSKSGVPMYLYYYPDWKDRVEVTYQHAEEMIDFYENEIGVKYPWPSYSQIPVQEFMYGAMENVTATVYGDFLFVDARSDLDRGYMSVNAHELAHQWFGDYVTARSDAHHWLQESFATYYDALFEKNLLGEDHFKWGMKGNQDAALSEGEKNDLPIAHSQAGSARHYPKGAFVLNMLKYVVGGREIYNRAIKNYLEKHAYGNVTSDDLLESFEETSGMNLHWFWDEWVYRGGEPEYNVNAEDLNENGKRFTRFTVEQVQHENEVTGLFKMPIWFEVHYSDGTMDHVMKWINEKTQIIDLANASGKTISYVLFDPNNEVLKKVHFKKSFEWLKNQAASAANMLDRYDALVAMRTIPVEQKREFLSTIYSKETFFATKSEIVSQLINDPNEISANIIKSAVNDKDVQMHKAVINSTNMIRKDMVSIYKQLLTSPSYEVVMNALDKLSFQYPDNTIEYLELTKGVIGTAGRNVEVKWLEIKAKMGGMDKDAIDKLVSYTGESYEFRTRVNAAQALKRLDYFDPTMMKNLINASFSANTRLANPCEEVLTTFYNQDRFRKMIWDYVSATAWNDWQREILMNVMK
ncbi:MAG: M1 family metallopeptidase [Bacteroidetes bacterium]|nr:M1 family metallopeptidase [Bacteroidota bacterium]